jgi:CheY-like chemotaxis protein
MTAPITTLSTPIPVILKRKRVLLLDSSRTKRDLRADVMRKLGIDVDSAADISEARSWWRADLYNLVLIDMENELGHRDKFCDDLRGATPPQQLAFFVGKPEYLANVPHANGHLPLLDDVVEVVPVPANVAGPSDYYGAQHQRWGILEASRRISAVRSASTARTRAMRERPTPPRDLETRESKRAAAWSQVLSEIQGQEKQ